MRLPGLVFVSCLFLLVTACGGGGGGDASGPGAATPPANPVPSNTAPSLSDLGVLSLQEGDTAIATLTATDAENDTLSFSITGGTDEALFTLSEESVLSFIEAPDFETELDANEDNDYEVTVQVSDGSLSDTSALVITVTDAFEGRVVDGPVAGADVFVDVNCNKTADDGEPSGVTDEDGFFAVPPFEPLPECAAKLISKGGVDTQTGQPLADIALISNVPEDLTQAVSVTPLTTVLSAAETEEEQQTILDAMGIEGTPEEILTTDQWAAAEEGDEDAQAVQRANQQISAVMQTAATIAKESDAGSSETDLALLITETVAAEIVVLVEETNGADLTDPDLLNTVMLETLEEALPEEDWDEEMIEVVAESVATVNTVMADESLDPTSDTAGDIAETVQEELQEQVEQVASGEITVEDFEEETAPEELLVEVVIADAPDNDGDGLADALDPDDDNDGVRDTIDAFPFDAAESLDTDGDSIGNNADTDDDGDGVEDGSDVFPLDGTEVVDSDSDGIGNNADADDDGDGVEDDSDAFPLDATETIDTDADDIGNNADTDDDGDGVADGADAFPLDSTETLDTDTDGIGNNADPDDDGDGVADGSDALPLDATETIDTDTDGIGNNADTDDDNDGVADVLDGFPEISVGDRTDTDNDGFPDDCDSVCEEVGMYADIDDDNDGVFDIDDAEPTDPEFTSDRDLDGVDDTNDVAPQNPLVGTESEAISIEELTAGSVDQDQLVLVETVPNMLGGPDFFLWDTAAYLLEHDGSFRRGNGQEQSSGSWELIDGAIELTEDESNRFGETISYIGALGDFATNEAFQFDTEALQLLESQASTYGVEEGTRLRIETVLLHQKKLTKISEQQNHSWDMVRQHVIEQYISGVYWGDTNVAVRRADLEPLMDISVPIRISAEPDILATYLPGSANIHFDEDFIAGTWAIDGIDLADSFTEESGMSGGCLNSEGSISRVGCSQLVTFEVNGRGQTVLGNEFDWEISDSGGVEIVFDNGQSTQIYRYGNNSEVEDAVGFLVYSENVDGDDYAAYRLGIEANHTGPISSTNVPLLSSFSQGDPRDTNRLADGSAVNNFGFILREGEEIDETDNFLWFGFPDGQISGSWVQSEVNGLTKIANTYTQDFGGFLIIRERDWIVLNETEERLYVLETYRISTQLDDVLTNVAELRRTNYYDIRPGFDYEDYDGDGVENVEDGFVGDSSRYLDSDGDGLEDNIDPNPDAVDEYDFDGDGVANAEDAFPLDSTETSDLDGDGIGDNADSDIDGDDIENDQDLFPLLFLDVTESEDVTADQIAEVSETVTSYLPTYIFPAASATTEPSVASPNRLVTFETDGSVLLQDVSLLDVNVNPVGWTDSPYFDVYGQWRLGNSDRQLFIELPIRGMLPIRPYYRWENFDHEVFSNGDVTQVVPTLDVVYELHKMADTSTETVFAVRRIVATDLEDDYAYLKLDPDKPVQIEEQIYQMTAPKLGSPLVWSSNEVIGTWVIDGVDLSGEDESTGNKTSCVTAWTQNAYSGVRCPRSLTFEQEGEGQSETGRTFNWSLNENGVVTITFSDNNQTSTIARFFDYGGSARVLVNSHHIGIEEDGAPLEIHYRDYTIAVKSDEDVDFGFFQDKFLSSALLGSEFGNRNPATGIKISNFGFTFDSNGDLTNLWAPDYYDDYLIDYLGSAVVQRSGVWEKTADDHVVAKYCDFVGVLDSLDLAKDISCLSDPTRIFTRERSWHLLKQTGDRLYVSESYDIRFNPEVFDEDGDGISDTPDLRFMSRVIFYEIDETWNPFDLDSDGVTRIGPDGSINDPNDYRPDIPFQFDSDGNVLVEDDADNDGVLDAEDAFPYQSGEFEDSDLDGVGNNEDTDDDNDGVDDELDTAPTNPLVSGEIEPILEQELLRAATSTKEMVLVGSLRGQLDDPSFAISTDSRYPGSYLLNEDGSYSYSGGHEQEEGRWNLVSGVLELTADATNLTGSIATPQSNWQNFDWDAWESAGAPGLESVFLPRRQLSRIASTDESWEMAWSTDIDVFIVGVDPAWAELNGNIDIGTFVTDVSLPVDSYEGSNGIANFRLGSSILPFTSEELVGAWGMKGVDLIGNVSPLPVPSANDDEADGHEESHVNPYEAIWREQLGTVRRVNGCVPSVSDVGIENGDAGCATLVLFQDDGHGTTALGNDFSWSITGQGTVLVQFDAGPETELARFENFADSIGLLTLSNSNMGSFSNYGLAVKANDEVDLSPFSDELLSSGYDLSNTYSARQGDGTLIDNWAFYFTCGSYRHDEEEGGEEDHDEADEHEARVYAANVNFECAEEHESHDDDVENEEEDVEEEQEGNSIREGVLHSYRIRQSSSTFEEAEGRWMIDTAALSDRNYTVLRHFNPYTAFIADSKWTVLSATATRLYFLFEWSLVLPGGDYPTIYEMSTITFVEKDIPYDLQDYDGDGVANEIDGFPVDPTRTQDTDGDGIEDSVDPDSSSVDEYDYDGDGVGNYVDLFPLDADETQDTDGDGIGDNSDEDIDGDGLLNDVDPTPYLFNGAIESIRDDDISDASITIEEIVPTYLFAAPSAEETPNFWIGGDHYYATFHADGYLDLDRVSRPSDYFGNGYDGGGVEIGYGEWELEAGVLKTSATLIEPIYPYYDYRLTNISNELLDSVDGGIFARTELEQSFVKLADTDTHTVFAVERETTIYLEGEAESLALDPNEPVFRSHDFYELKAPKLGHPLPFTDSEILGSWAMNGVDLSGAEPISSATDFNQSCSTYQGSWSLENFGCAHVLSFDADGTGYSSTGRTFSWTLTSEGALSVTFDDDGQTSLVRRYQDFDESSAVLTVSDIDGTSFEAYSLAVKKQDNLDLGPFQNVALSGAYHSTWLDNRNSLTNIKIGNFTFRLNPDGTSETTMLDRGIYSAPELDDDEPGSGETGAAQVYVEAGDWTQNDNEVVIRRCWTKPHFPGGDPDRSCLTTPWEGVGNFLDSTYLETTLDMIATTETRLYVINSTKLKLLTYDENNDVAPLTLSHATEFTYFYDIDNDWNPVDPDSDGFETGELDPNPFDPALPGDTDGDGLSDAIDPDLDGDGVVNDRDVFPADPEESADTDGDGVGNNADIDADNDGVSDAVDICYADPTQVLGEDRDADGVCDVNDADNDNDGISDEDEAIQGTDLFDATSFPSSGGYISVGAALYTSIPGSISSDPTYDADTEVATVTVRRMMSDQGEISVKYRLLAGANSIAGQHYIDQEGELIWSDGDDTEKTVDVELITTAENGYQSQTVLFELYDASSNAVLAANRSSIGFARDKPELDAQLGAENYGYLMVPAHRSIFEEGDLLSFDVRRLQGNVGTVSVDYQLNFFGDQDCGVTEPLQGTITWEDGDVTLKKVQFQSMDDNIPSHNNDQAVASCRGTFDLSNAVTGDGESVALAPEHAGYTGVSFVVQDNDYNDAVYAAVPYLVFVEEGAEYLAELRFVRFGPLVPAELSATVEDFYGDSEAAPGLTFANLYSSTWRIADYRTDYDFVNNDFRWQGIDMSPRTVSIKISADDYEERDFVVLLRLRNQDGLDFGSLGIYVSDTDVRNPSKDTDGDGIVDLQDLDIDGDGVRNVLDDDLDGDGVVNLQDSHISDSEQFSDRNHNGLADQLEDSDGDGFVDANDSFPDDPWRAIEIVAQSVSVGLRIMPESNNSIDIALDVGISESANPTFEITDGPNLGTLDIEQISEGIVTYTHSSESDPGFVGGTDSFDFNATAPGYNDVSEGTITVNLISDPLYGDQWYLRNIGQLNYASSGGDVGADANVSDAHADGITGTGVIAAIVDEGLEIGHEDLQANIIGGYDYVDNDSDPTLRGDGGDHGTSVAGILGAVGWNEIGIRGIAPDVSLKGFNFLRSDQLPSTEIQALGGASYSDDVDIFNLSYGVESSYGYSIANTTFEDWIENGSQNLRDGLGAIFVKSSGNGFTGLFDGFTQELIECPIANSLDISCQNSAQDPSHVLPQMIVVAALNAGDGDAATNYFESEDASASYSTGGAANWISAPGGEFGENNQIIEGYSNLDEDGNGLPGKPAMMTTDQSGCDKGYVGSVWEASNAFDNSDSPVSSNESCSYTSTFNGTSSAAPMVSGAVALMLQSNGGLTWRDVKHILANTARKLDVNRGEKTYSGVVVDTGWITNAAGYNFHNTYGFGALDTSAAVTMAENYDVSLGDMVKASATSVSVNQDGTPASVDISEETVTVLSQTRQDAGLVDAVRVSLSISHEFPKELSIALISPSGTRSVLLSVDSAYSDITETFELSTNAFYREPAVGEWSLEIFDHDSTKNQGTITSWVLTIYSSN